MTINTFQHLHDNTITNYTKTLQNQLHLEYQEYERHSLRMKLLREKRLQALFLIKRFFKTKVLRSYRNQKLKNAKYIIANCLKSYYIVKRLRRQKLIYLKKIILIQSLIRRKLVKNWLKRRENKAIKIQATYRMYRSKKMVQKKRWIKFYQQLIPKKYLAKLIWKNWQKYLKRKAQKRMKAAIIIFYRILAFIRWKKYQKIKEMKRLEEERKKRQTLAANLIQKEFSKRSALSFS
jgi:hypothetical protein